MMDMRMRMRMRVCLLRDDHMGACGFTGWRWLEWAIVVTGVRLLDVLDDHRRRSRIGAFHNTHILAFAFRWPSAIMVVVMVMMNAVVMWRWR